MMDFVFEEMGLRFLEAKIHAERQAIVEMNKRLGYRLMEGQAGEVFQRWRVGKAEYVAAVADLRTILEKFEA
ncbi:MAG: hypothetical protein AAF570_16975 [Bacteroidota bacterium]